MKCDLCHKDVNVGYNPKSWVIPERYQSGFFL